MNDRPKVPEACSAVKQLNDLKSDAPLLTLHCDQDRNHEAKTHWDAAYNVRWFG